MKKLVSAILILGIIVFAYLIGPKPSPPDLDKKYSFNFPTDLIELEETIAQKENQIPNIKAGNEAKFVWNDSIPQKTKTSFVYIHGFSASHVEGNPVHENLAKEFGGNLYLARLASHGIDTGDETMADLTADALIASAEEAIQIGKLIGDEVVIIATSAGGALTTYLASKHPELKAILLYSPCIKVYDENAELLDNHWGLKMAQTIQGKDFNDITPKNETQPLYWSMHYRLEALVALQNFLTHAMNKDNFEKVKVPTFMAYYYENEENQDKVVSVPAMLEMWEQLGTPVDKKVKIALPTTRDHVIASYVMSEDWGIVQKESIAFLKRIVGLKPNSKM
ncbi:Esterase/lipase [Spirosomataceae bacterium TFI 002]|nr:Esterase/lipase [Spirosomataceae bacterium TFI 002]